MHGVSWVDKEGMNLSNRFYLLITHLDHTLAKGKKNQFKFCIRLIINTLQKQNMSEVTTMNEGYQVSVDQDTNSFKRMVNKKRDSNDGISSNLEGRARRGS